MKQITIGDIVYALTPDKIRRIKDGIAETESAIARHMKRRPEDREEKRLQDWRDHIKKLEGFLEGAEE